MCVQFSSKLFACCTKADAISSSIATVSQTHAFYTLLLLLLSLYPNHPHDDQTFRKCDGRSEQVALAFVIILMKRTFFPCWHQFQAYGTCSLAILDPRSLVSSSCFSEGRVFIAIFVNFFCLDLPRLCRIIRNSVFLWIFSFFIALILNTICRICSHTQMWCINWHSGTRTARFELN